VPAAPAPDPAALAAAAPAPDPAALAAAADALAAAERPVIIADFAARPPHGWEHVIAIAETLGAPVWDCNSRLNFPSNHPLNLGMAPKECYDGADVVLALDIADFEGPTHVRDIATRTVVNTVPETATWIDIGFTDVEVSKWSMDYGRTFHAHHRMTADPVIGTTQLVALLQERIGRNADPDRPPHLEREAGYGHRHLVPVLLGFFAPRCP
jgi:acetolactate synthase I/II/III large subunit